MVMAVVVLAGVALAGVAQAGERLQFVAPAGWTVDADKAKAVHAEIYATDERTQPPATMFGLEMQKPMPTPDDAFVRGFLAGAKKKAPMLVEVRHDPFDIVGVRAVRVIADVDVDGVAARQAYYVMPAGDDTAILLVSAGRDAFEGRLAEFDGIARATRGLGASTDSDDAAYRLGYQVGRVIGFLLVFVALFFVVRALVRATKKSRS
jgi:hypothetical protein